MPARKIYGMKISHVSYLPNSTHPHGLSQTVENLHNGEGGHALPLFPAKRSTHLASKVRHKKGCMDSVFCPHEKTLGAFHCY